MNDNTCSDLTVSTDAIKASPWVKNSVMRSVNYWQVS